VLKLKFLVKQRPDAKPSLSKRSLLSCDKKMCNNLPLKMKCLSANSKQFKAAIKKFLVIHSFCNMFTECVCCNYPGFSAVSYLSYKMNTINLYSHAQSSIWQKNIRVKFENSVYFTHT